MGEKTVNPKMIVLARQSRGLTQSRLAIEAGIPQARISKIESGMTEVGGETLTTLAKVLDYPGTFFYQQDELYGFDTSVLFHRKRESIGSKILDKVHALINIRRIHIARLLEAADIDPAKSFPRF